MNVLFPCKLSTGAFSQRLPEMIEPDRWRGWLLWILLAVLFTPSFRLPGNIPFRIDDVLVFGAGGILAAKCLLGLPVPKLDRVFIYTFVVVGTILLSTLNAPDNLEITAKEYLDCLRPVKFFLVYWLVRDCNPVTSLRTFIRTISVASFILLAITCVEMFFARTAPGSIVVQFFSLFTEKPSYQLLDMMATRPYATFNTPTDLGYVATVCLFAGPLISSPRHRRAVVATCFLIILITATRTMLFSLPLLLIVQAVYARGTVLEALKRLRFSLAMITLAGVSSVVLLPIISPHASEFTQSMVVSVASGDTDGEDSITTRVGNLYLVSYAWEQSPVTGVGARTLLPEFVDCELIMTFHRYGLLGLTMLLLIYPLGFGLVHKAASCNREYSQFSVVALVATFLIGITQGALTNSRTGVLLFVIIGLAQAWKDHGPDKESY